MQYWRFQFVSISSKMMSSHIKTLKTSIRSLQHIRNIKFSFKPPTLFKASSWCYACLDGTINMFVFARFTVWGHSLASLFWSLTRKPSPVPWNALSGVAVGSALEIANDLGKVVSREVSNATACHPRKNDPYMGPWTIARIGYKKGCRRVTI